MVLLRACSVGGVALLVMWRSESGVEPAAASPSSFWELLALLGREPGMEWLLRCPNGCAGSLGSSGQEPGGGDRVGMCGSEGSGHGGLHAVAKVSGRLACSFLGL